MAREQKMRERRALKAEKKEDKKLAAANPGEEGMGATDEVELINLNDPNPVR